MAKTKRASGDGKAASSRKPASPVDLVQPIPSPAKPAEIAQPASIPAELAGAKPYVPAREGLCEFVACIDPMTGRTILRPKEGGCPPGFVDKMAESMGTFGTELVRTPLPALAAKPEGKK